jgi:hypothetical protein
VNKFKYDNIEKYKYRLTEDYQFRPPKGYPTPVSAHLVGTHVDDGWIEISVHGHIFFFSEGYCWDGSSGPTIDSKKCQLAGLIHDGAYQMLREGVYGIGEIKEEAREFFDNLYRDMCREDGMGTFRSWLRWKGLRWFGRRSANGN